MADYVEIPLIAAGTGVKVLTDDITQLNGSSVSSVPAQRQKAGWGADGVFNDVSVASPFPVSVISGGGGGDASAANQVTGNNSLATIAASVPVSVESVVNLTRPADTTPYSANDAVSNSTSSPTILTFTGSARTSGGSGYITKARLMTNASANTQRMRLHLYSTAPTAIADNAQQTILYANRANYVGSIDFTGLVTEGTGSDTAYSVNNSPRLPFNTNGSSSLFGMLESLDAFTPASAQTFFVALTAEQN